MDDVLIVDAVRSPIGKRNGTLSTVRADELAAQVLNGLVQRHDVDPGAIEDVQMGCVTQLGEQGLNVGRIATLIAGWPETVCASAIDRGRFENEIVPIEVENPHVGVLFAVDETPRRDTSAEKLAQLRPAFKDDGKVTAGNSSQIVDGSAAVLLTSERRAQELGLRPRARFVSFGLAGVEPYRMLHGNPQACARALERAGLTWDDMAVIEVNEAFASVVLQFVRDAGLEDRMDDINPNGGGISLGHPLGATGARMTATLLNELERRGDRYGIATMCVGFGMAIAGLIERL